MTAPIDQLPGGGTACRTVADDVAVHWYPTDAGPGDQCWCGTVRMSGFDFDDDYPEEN